MKIFDKWKKRETLVLMSNNSIFIPTIQKDYNFLSGSNRFICKDYNSGIELIKKTKSKQKSIKLENSDKIKTYKINKSEVKKRIFALSQLEISRNNLIFWSVSFPCGFTDIQAIKVLNNVLTGLRKGKNWFQYVWIAERQKNGTIHFHFVVNKFFNVRIVNFKFAKAIENELSKENKFDIKFKTDSYNGFDCKKIYNISGLSNYITKYVTKSNDEFLCHAWGVDRITSSLFVSCCVELFALKNLDKSILINENVNNSNYKNEFGSYYYFKSMNNSSPWKMLQKTNQGIYNLLISMKFEVKLNPIKYEFKEVESIQLKSLSLFPYYQSE